MPLIIEVLEPSAADRDWFVYVDLPHKAVESTAGAAIRGTGRTLREALIDVRRKVTALEAHLTDIDVEMENRLFVLPAEDANEHPTCAAADERQQPSQGTRLQPGSRDVGEAGAGPGETGVEGC